MARFSEETLITEKQHGRMQYGSDDFRTPVIPELSTNKEGQLSVS